MEQNVSVKGKDGSKKRYKIIYNREDCIGAAACIAAYPERWEMADDGRADLKGGKSNDDNSVQELEISEDEFKQMMDAAQACPVSVIHIEDLQTKKRII
ncbi:MAG: ferredoxin [Candidatus Woesearchaeota archaeon]